jgi:molecular chaperone GrpE (heat shock protein)
MIEAIENKLSEILKDKKDLSIMIEENQRKKEQLLDEVFLDAISVLDAFSREEKVIEDHEWNQSEDSQKAIKRLLNAKKKLNTMLEKYNVEKIVFNDGMSNDDLCSVTDTEPDVEKPNGYILSIEKEGYIRNGHMLRRAEVVIVKN